MAMQSISAPDLRPIFHILGLLIVVVAVAMMVPLGHAFFHDDPSWAAFFIALFAGTVVGGLLFFSTRSDHLRITPRQGFVLLLVCWIGVPLYAALPFKLALPSLSFTDCVFEAVSGLTTTGSTIFADVEVLPPSVLLWRALLQWLGGMGTIAMALTVLPFLKIGGMQLFLDVLSRTDKDTPRLTVQAQSLVTVYIALTVLCGGAYFLAGLSPFDSVAHALSTVSTGGFSTRTESIGAFGSPVVSGVALVFMLAGGLPFLLLVRAARGDAGALLGNRQVQWFLVFCALATFLIAPAISPDFLYLSVIGQAAFVSVSFLTGTGFALADYGTWAPAATALLFFMTFAGACSGSTSGGIRVFRFQILYATMGSQLRKLLYPSGVFVPHFQGRPLPTAVTSSVLGFFFAFTIVFVCLAAFLALTGLDPLTSLSAAASAVSNSGGGLGPILGPGGSYAPLSDAAKTLLMAGMIVGRLEVLTVLVLFSAHFWRP